MILYVDCCPRKESRTRKLASALLEKLGQYVEIRLCELSLAPLDEERLSTRMRLLAENRTDADEFALARQFASADTVVIASPFWDLSFPSLLKMYIENIYITGIVSHYGSNGVPVGLCRAKKLYYVTTSGGPYDGKYSYEYLRTLCWDYFGIPDTELIKAEMLDIAGNDPEAILFSAMESFKGGSGIPPQ